MDNRILLYLFQLLTLMMFFCSCSKEENRRFQGYVEAEFVYVSSPIAGRLDKLMVNRGQTIEANTPLYMLEHQNELADVKRAQAHLQAANFQLEDIKTGKREVELDVYRAQLQQARAAEHLSATQHARDEEQFKIGAISKAQLDSSRADQQRNIGKIEELVSELKSGALPARPDQIRVQEEAVKAAAAGLDQAQWKLSQKSASAVQAGFVFDTLYVEGEWVNAGHPVVILLPPGNIKVRFFVPEDIMGSLKIGQSVTIHCNGCSTVVPAKITYISPRVEFTPPVIYSNETRSKLIFMFEAKPSSEDAFLLHPGQPVEVDLDE